MADSKPHWDPSGAQTPFPYLHNFKTALARGEGVPNPPDWIGLKLLPVHEAPLSLLKKQVEDPLLKL